MELFVVSTSVPSPPNVVDDMRDVRTATGGLLSPVLTIHFTISSFARGRKKTQSIIQTNHIVLSTLAT